MRLIASHADREFHLRSIAPGEGFASPFSGEPYPALVWAAAPAAGEERDRLASALIASGCRYVVCGGVDCAAWEDAADREFMELDLPDPEYVERFVMTTSHPDESEGDVVFFFVHNTRFGEHRFSRHLVLVFGPDERVEQRLTDAVRAEAPRCHAA